MSSVQKAAATENQLQALVLKPVRELNGPCLKVLSEGEYLIGSAEHCDFQLPFDGIAAEHCKLQYDGNRAILHAIDPRIWVNDGPANGISLRRKDRVSIGPVNFLFEHAQPEQAEDNVSKSVDEDRIQAESHLLQSLQRAIAREQIEPDEIAAFIPETTSIDSVESEKVLDELNQAIGRSQKQQAEHREALSRIQEESSEKIEELQKQIAEQTQTSQRHEQVLSEKQCEIELLTNQFETRIKQLTAREQELQETLDAAKEMETEWQEREQKYLAEQKDFEKQLNSLEEKLNEATSQLNSSQVSDLERQFQQEKQTWEQQRKELESELQKTREHQNELEQQMLELQSEITVAQEQVCERNEQITALENQMEGIQQELRTSEERFQQEKARTEELQLQLEQAVESAQEQQQEQNAVIERVEKEKEAAIEELKLAHEQELCELESLRATNEQKNAETDSLQQELKQLQEQQADLYEQKLKNAAELEKIEAARDELEAEKEAFTQARKDIQEIREELELERQKLKQDQEPAEPESDATDDPEPVGLEQEEKFAASAQEEAIESEILAHHQSEQLSPAEELENSGCEEIDCEQATEEEDLEINSSAEQTTCADQGVEVEDEQDETLEKEEPLQEQTETANQQSLDLDFGELGNMLNSANSPVETDTVEDASVVEEASQRVSLDGKAGEPNVSSEVDEIEVEHCEDENAGGDAGSSDAVSSDAESDDATQDSVLELRGELAKLFGLDQAEQSDESVQEMDEVTEESSQCESTEHFSGIAEEMITAEEQNTDEGEAESPCEETAIEESAQELSGSTEVTVEDVEDPDSISAYMKALFERTSGKQDYCELDLSTRPIKEKVEEPVQQLPAVTDAVAEEPKQETVPAKPQGPIAKVDRESVALEIASLRDVANQTARSALCTYTWKKLRMKILINGVLTVTGGVASAVLLTAPLWGSQSYAGYGLLTLLFTAITAIESTRANMMVNRLKASASQTNDSCPNNKGEADE